MAKITLRSIFSKKSDITSLLPDLISQMAARLVVTDENGAVLFGNTDVPGAERHPVMLNEGIVGWVTGDEKSASIARLLSVLLLKEFERKNLGNEVLLLYQEVNMVFNFSDKLAQAIGPAAISKVAVEEALHLIRSASGVVVLWNEETRQLDVPAAAGEPLFHPENITANSALLMKIGMNGNSDILTDLTTLHEAGIIAGGVQSLLYAALKVKHRVMGAIILAGDQPMQFAASDLKFLITLGLQSSSAIESALLYEKNLREAREKEEAMRRIYEITAKFVPFEFIGSLGHKVITDVKLGDQVEKVVTVLFTDIRDYTSISEQMSPEENFRFVSSYNNRMGPIIRDHEGFINQYLGDAIMALFPENPGKALEAAIEMQRNVREFSKTRLAQGGHAIRMGIGMHTGPLIMGITGDRERLDATTISDAVNTASRIESLTKYYKANILVSDATIRAIPRPGRFHLRYLGKVQVKGRQSALGIYECFSSDTEEQVLLKEQTLPVFLEGMDHYLRRSFQQAVRAFESVMKVNPEDRTAQFLVYRSQECLQRGVPENWSGVVEMSTK